MSNERTKVLQMVADGTINPEDAEKLLDRLEGPDTGADQAKDDSGQKQHPRIKYLRVVVDDDRDQVNIRLPLGLIRAGIKLAALMPKGASERLSSRGIDLSQLNGLEGEELMAALGELCVDVDTESGGTVRVCCE